MKPFIFGIISMLVLLVIFAAMFMMSNNKNKSDESSTFYHYFSQPHHARGMDPALASPVEKMKATPMKSNSFFVEKFSNTDVDCGNTQFTVTKDTARKLFLKEPMEKIAYSTRCHVGETEIRERNGTTTCSSDNHRVYRANDYDIGTVLKPCVNSSSVQMDGTNLFKAYGSRN